MSSIGNDIPTPDSGTSGNDDVSPSFDFERGYNELRPEYTRVTQELGTYREQLNEYEQLFEALHDPDPETQAQAMAVLGLELETGSSQTDDDGDEYADPLEREVQELRGFVDEIRSARELETQERESARMDGLRDEFIGDAIGIIEDSLKPTYGDNFRFTDNEEMVLGHLAIQMADERGVPDVEGAYNILYGGDGVLETNRSRWIASKHDAFSAPLGTTIPAEQRPRNRKERIQWIDSRVAAQEMQQ